MNSDSALARSKQMSRDKALKRKQEVYHIEDEDVIRLCLKRLSISKTEFEDYMAIPVKTLKMAYKNTLPVGLSPQSGL